MIIQNNTNTNFKARRILKTQHYFRSGNSPKSEIVEIFELDSAKDLDFAKKCYNLLGNIHSRNLAPLQRQLKIFFKSFLSFSKFSNHYYLAIKNSDTISGGMSITPCIDIIHATQAFSEYPKSTNIENIFCGILNEISKNYNKYSLRTYNYINSIKSDISSNEISNIKKNIEKTHKNNTIYDFTEEVDVDLEEVLDIKDFETDVLY